MDAQFEKDRVGTVPYSVGQRLTRLESEVDSITNKFEDFKIHSVRNETILFERLDTLVRDGEETKSAMKETNQKIDFLIEQQNKAHSEKWNKVVMTAIGAFVGGFVAYALKQLGVF